MHGCCDPGYFVNTYILCILKRKILQGAVLWKPSAMCRHPSTVLGMAIDNIMPCSFMMKEDFSAINLLSKSHLCACAFPWSSASE